MNHIDHIDHIDRIDIDYRSKQNQTERKRDAETQLNRSMLPFKNVSFWTPKLLAEGLSSLWHVMANPTLAADRLFNGIDRGVGQTQLIQARPKSHHRCRG